MERDVKFLKTELEDLNECVNKETIVDLIYEIVFSIISNKYEKISNSSNYSLSEDFDE